jgi:RNA polymerase sigma-70 factor (ECF subfamily)
MSDALQDAQDLSDMARLAAGHDAALNDLMERHAARLFHYLCRYLDNESEADDLAQETFVRVFQNRARFNPNHRFSTWLYTIATNLLRDRLRWRARHPSVSLDTEAEQGCSLMDAVASQAASPSESAVLNERAQTVRRAIGQLPEELRVALILFEYEDKSHAEIGAILDCSAKAVEMRLYRARQQLKSKLPGLQ